jgi:hypothetical protein
LAQSQSKINELSIESNLLKENNKKLQNEVESLNKSLIEMNKELQQVKISKAYDIKTLTVNAK